MTHEFDNIRPYAAGEMKHALNELLGDRQFSRLLQGFVPWLPGFVRNAIFRLAFIGIKTPLDFQVRYMKPVVNYVLRKSSKGVTADFKGLRRDGNYTFISNHRDIVLDASILDLLLHDNGFSTTCEIAIGDNLLIYPWIENLVRMNKAFIVRRSLQGKDRLEGSRLMSRYMHHAIRDKKENIWIAQREGRAKDSSDNTQYSLLRMLALGGDPTRTTESLKEVNLVPLTISYEYDPCDYLKAMEFQCKRDNPEWKKSKKDDLDNMKTGIMGQKGRICYTSAGEAIDAILDRYPQREFTKEQFIELAADIDKIIHSNYHLFPGNYVAYDLLNNSSKYSAQYTEEERKVFMDYVDSRLKLVTLDNPDWDFLRERIYTMYANPVINKEKCATAL